MSGAKITCIEFSPHGEVVAAVGENQRLSILFCKAKGIICLLVK